MFPLQLYPAGEYLSKESRDRKARISVPMALICGQADIIILEPAAWERKGSGRLYKCFKCDKMISGQSGSGQRRGREEAARRRRLARRRSEGRRGVRRRVRRMRAARRRRNPTHPPSGSN